ncbi:MAG: tyrosine-type recombinase/integrase [Verrucomicrobia bacterium]|nr:tyrosine-type recombinase/integrase [Verrucomicrobiota bacterium]
MNTEKYKEWLLIKGYSKNTTESNITMLQRFLQWLEKESIDIIETTYNDVMAFIQSCNARGNERQTIQQYVVAIRHYYNHLIYEGEMNDNPASNVEIKGIKRRKLHDTLNVEELEQLYKSYPAELETKKKSPPQQLNQLARRRTKVMLGLLIYQGIKVDELAELEVTDLKLREGKIFIKGKRRTNERTMKLEGFQIIDLMDYINETRKALLAINQRETTKLFFSKDRGNNFSNMMHSLVKSLKQHNSKIKDIKQIRASVITNWLQQYNLRQVQYMAGHRYVSSTEAYQANNIAELQNEIFKHHPIS